MKVSPQLRLRAVVLGLGLLTTATASAHPGHGSIPSDEVAHWVAEPWHALVWLVVVGVAWALHRRARTAS